MEFQLFGHSNVPPCKVCKGDGTNLWDPDSECSICEGEGYIKQDVLSQRSKDERCTMCTQPLGEGHVFNHKRVLFLYCDRCHKIKSDPCYSMRQAFWAL